MSASVDASMGGCAAIGRLRELMSWRISLQMGGTGQLCAGFIHAGE